MRQALLDPAPGTAAIVGVLLLLLAVVGWQAARRWHSEKIASVSALEALAVKVELQHHLQFDGHSLVRMARRWEYRGETPLAEWEADAKNYLADNPEFQALARVDASGRVQRLLPAAGNSSLKGRDLRADAVGARAMDSACRLREPRTACLLEPGGAGRRLYVLAPIMRGAACDGFILGVIRIDAFLINTLMEMGQTKDWAIAIMHGEDVLFELGTRDAPSAHPWTGRASVDCSGALLTVQLTATAAKRSALGTRLPEATLAGGLLATMLTWLALSLAARARRHALEAERATADLRVQAEARSRTEATLTEHVRVAELGAAVSLALTRERDLRPVLEECVEAVVSTLDVAFARIWTYNADLDLLELQASAGLYSHIDGAHARVSLDSSMFAIIARERRPYLTNSVCSEVRIDRDWAAREGLVAFAGHPMVVDGQLVGAMVAFARKPLPGFVLRALGAAADILAVGVRRLRSEAALRESQENLRQAQKTEAVGRLAGGIAHDFNNILTVISGNTEFLLEDERLPEHALLEAADIRDAANRAASLTRQLLAFSRKQVLQPKVLDLTVVVENVEKMLRRLIGEDIALVTALDPNAGHVLADPGQLEQVLLNLVVNARDAMPAGGKLTIETGNAEPAGSPAEPSGGPAPGRRVRLAVRDTGCGMEPETLSRIFEPFYTTKEVGKGTGLGLATVQGIVQQSGGQIFVESQPGRGTTFSIHLPRVDEPLTDVRPVSAALPVGGHGQRVLLVEDNPEVRALAHRILSGAGFSVVVAAEPSDALELASRGDEPLHLLVTDIVMPGQSGKSLAKRLHELHPEMKIVYMSGYTDEEIGHHGVVSTDVAFVPKPFTAASLLEVVGRALESAG